jgi:hypothetical protein
MRPLLVILTDRMEVAALADDRSRYRFGPLERRGLIAGWRGGQVVAVAASLVLAVGVLRARTDIAGAIVAVAVVAASVVFACWPIGGRTAEEWLPTVARWVLEARGGRRQHALISHEGTCVPTRVSRSRRATATGGTGVFAGLEILDVDREGRPSETGDPRSHGVGVMADRRTGTYTAVMRVRAHSFALLGPSEKQRRVVGWASILASLAREGSTVHRIQWLAVTLPDDGRAVRHYLEDHTVASRTDATLRSYEELLTSVGAATCRHEVLLALQVRPGRGRRSVSDVEAVTRACALALREAMALWRLLEDADIEVDALLGPQELAETIQRGSEPRPLGTPNPRATAPGAASSVWPWPMGLDTQWASVRTDGTWHATYWIAEWPRIDVGPDFLGPILLGAVRRSVSVVMEPISPTLAVRQVEQARTADIADAQLRSRGGFLRTARRSRESDLVLRREGELADGHASFRFSGYVTVTAPSLEQLAEACDATEQAAGQAHLSLRRLYGDQARAYACTLPLCRGLS